MAQQSGDPLPCVHATFMAAVANFACFESHAHALTVEPRGHGGCYLRAMASRYLPVSTNEMSMVLVSQNIGYVTRSPSDSVRN